MNFLFKMPSRGRPERFKSTLQTHLNCLSGKYNYKFIFSFDNDDETMKGQDILDFLNQTNIDYEVNFGDNKNKIEAINANMDNRDFDILVLIADDQIATMGNYDERIVEIFEKSEHGLDSMIHFYTPRWSFELDVWNIMGKKYYDRFGYIYHPSYKSIFADNEYTEVAVMLNRRIMSELCPFFHDWKGGDYTEVKNWYFNNDDSRTYEERKKLNFDLN